MPIIRAGQLIFVALVAVLVVIIVRNLSHQNPVSRAQTQLSNRSAIPATLQPPLTIASRQGDEMLVRKLISKGADVNERISEPIANATNQYDFSPLESAIKFGHQQVARILLAHGADIKEYRYGLLLYDAVRRTPEIVPELLKRGADVNESGDRHANQQLHTNLNPLCAAIRRRDRVIVQVLLEHGANVNPVTGYIVPPITVLGPPSSPPPVGRAGRIVTPLDTLPPTTVEPSSPLGVAVCYAPEFEPLLLKRGGALGADRGCILAGAAHANRPGLFPRLLALGAKINGADEKGETALTYITATTTGSVSYLLEHGADPNSVPRSGRSALTHAAISGNAEAVRLLVAHKAEVNQVSRTGHTPLYFALRHKREDIAELLRRAGGKE